MVILEFYDKTPLNNICGALLCQPEQVIFVGSNIDKMERGIEKFKTVLRNNNINTNLSYICTDKNDLYSIVDKLSQIVEHFDDSCAFDITGGDELFLVAVGIVMEKYGEKVQCHRFNFNHNEIYDCDADGKVLDVKSFDISIEDNISIYGGDIVTDHDEDFYTYFWDFNKDFLLDIESMWSICRNNPKLWNAQINTLGAICDSFEMTSPLQIYFNQETARSVLYDSHDKYTLLPWMLSKFQKCGLISSLYIDDIISFKFKNDQVKRCLTVAGQILELFIAKKMLSIKDTDGSPLYNDIKVGTVIRWGQSDDDDETSTVNEIDVIAMKGAIPVFISCKNGYFNANELYKLNTVADKFGNNYAKKVLVATDMSKLGTQGELLNARMSDMGIKCISDLDQMDDETLENILASIWKD